MVDLSDSPIDLRLDRLHYPFLDLSSIHLYLFQHSFRHRIRLHPATIPYSPQPSAYSVRYHLHRNMDSPCLATIPCLVCNSSIRTIHYSPTTSPLPPHRPSMTIVHLYIRNHVPLFAPCLFISKCLPFLGYRFVPRFMT